MLWTVTDNEEQYTLHLFLTICFRFIYSNTSTDFRFLEESKRLSDSVKQELQKKNTVSNQVKHLRKECERREIDLLIMPVQMSRRKNNTSIYNKK
jgi:hypothetical protein